MKIAITGDSMAARICAHLLIRDRIGTVIHQAPRPPVPVVMLSDPALALLRDVLDRPTLFSDKFRIERRIVSWGGNDPVVLPHGAIVLSETDLVGALTMQGNDADGTCSFSILTAPPFPAGTKQRFGSRSATPARVSLRHAEDRSACWIEAVESGWLFLIPGDTAGWLLGIGAPIQTLNSQSRHIAARIDLIEQPAGTFDTSPRMLTALQGQDWLACGTSAIAFDPICGDGTAQSIREAILAAAVIAAIRDGGDAGALRSHYEAMLIASMRRHLKMCADFYRTGGSSDWWMAQAAALAEGHGWCTDRLAITPEPRYQLRDFRLVERPKAA